MTREEAAEFTRKLLEMAEINAFPGKPKRINNIPVFYFEAALSALRGPQPDPAPLDIVQTLNVWNTAMGKRCPEENH